MVRKSARRCSGHQLESLAIAGVVAIIVVLGGPESGNSQTFNAIANLDRLTPLGRLGATASPPRVPREIGTDMGNQYPQPLDTVRPREEKRPPFAIFGPQKITTTPTQFGKFELYQIVGNSENPAWAGGAGLAGANGSPLTSGCLEGVPPTSNRFALELIKSFPGLVQSVAAVIAVEGDMSALIGTASVVRPDLLLTAGHVIDEMIGNGRWNKGPAKILGKRLYAVFDLDVSRFPRGFPKGIDWDRQPGAIRIPGGTPTYIHPAIDVDVGVVKVNVSGRSAIPLASVTPQPGTGSALIGVAGRTGNVDSKKPGAYDRNYAVCGLAKPVDGDFARQTPVVLRIGTGDLADAEGPSIVRFRIDALGGNSGAPVVERSSGALVGMNFGTAEGYPVNQAEYNRAVTITAIREVLTAGSTALDSRIARERE